MKIVVDFDLWVLDKCQRFSDWLTRRFRVIKANLKLVIFCVSTYVVSSISYILLYSIPESHSFWSIFLDCFIILIIFLIGVSLNFQVENLEKKNDSDVRSSPEKNSGFRMIYMCLVLLGLIVDVQLIFLEKIDLTKFFLRNLDGLGLLFAFYFLNCSSLPPSKEEEEVPANMVPVKS